MFCQHLAKLPQSAQALHPLKLSKPSDGSRNWGAWHSCLHTAVIQQLSAQWGKLREGGKTSKETPQVKNAEKGWNAVESGRRIYCTRLCFGAKMRVTAGLLQEGWNSVEGYIARGYATSLCIKPGFRGSRGHLKLYLRSELTSLAESKVVWSYTTPCGNRKRSERNFIA